MPMAADPPVLGAQPWPPPPWTGPGDEAIGYRNYEGNLKDIILWHDESGRPYIAGSADQLAMAWVEGRGDERQGEAVTNAMVFDWTPSLNTDRIMELSRKEWRLEDRLRDARQRVRIAEGLVHVCGATNKKVHKEAHWHRAVACKIEEKIEAVRRERESLEYDDIEEEENKDDCDMAEGKDKDDDDKQEHGETQDESPSPATRSPITFVGWLSLLRIDLVLKQELDKILRALASPCLERRDALAGISKGQGWPRTACRTSGLRIREALGHTMAGTDTRGFRLPLDGVRESGGLAGTKPRGFCCPPDPGSCNWREEILTRLRPICVGTDERQFRRPPDPMWAGLKLNWKSMQCARTEERSFCVLPNGKMDLLAAVA